MNPNLVSSGRPLFGILWPSMLSIESYTQSLTAHLFPPRSPAARRQHDGELYTLKLDVCKFFYSIDRSVLQRLIERKINDCCLVDLMMVFATTHDPVGIPIGNLLSQIYALIYLNPLDHYIKRKLKIKHYLRYVDDLVLIGLTRPQCQSDLADELHLELSRSTIQKIKRGVNFAGYRTWRSKRYIRKYSLHKFNRKVQAGKTDAVISLLGHAKRTNSLPYMVQTLKQSGMIDRLPEKVQRGIAI